MDERFSGTVRITNISDFIAPSANCIIPLQTRTGEPLVAVRKKLAPSSNAKKDTIRTVKISLNDCLACSGCITSAETILVEEQSVTRWNFWQATLCCYGVSAKCMFSSSKARAFHFSGSPTNCILFFL